MRSKLRWLLVPLSVAALATGLAACGGDDDGEPTDAGATGVPEEFAPVTAPPDDAQEGGELTVISAGDIDYMDPGAAYYQFTYMLTQATHRLLVAWAPDDVEAPTPDLAEGEPEISDDGRTLEFTIREGVRYSPPVDREVTADDVVYAIERTTLPGVANQYFSTYAGDVVGYEEAAKEAADNPTGGAPDIEGVSAPDDRTVRIEFNEPEVAIAEVVAQVMSLPISAPIPEEYAREFDAKNPSTYGQYVAFTGPYMVENDPETGELTGYTPGKEIKLVRNPNWDGEATGDFRPAYLDEITFLEGFDDTASASRRILNGEGQVSGDFPPPPSVLKEAAQEAEPEQLQLPVLPGYRHIALNTQAPPFDDINVRKAVIANSDREALRNTRGGELIGQVATHYLSPGFPGFEEAGGFEGFDLDFLANPNGDPELAAEYMREAGYESGKCEGPECEITMVGDNIPPGKDTAEVFKGQLEELGFKVSFRPVDHTIMYTRFCSVPEQQPEVCPNVGWLPDFRDPQAALDVPFYGPTIDPENNSNWPQLDVPEVNEAIEEARLAEGADERAEAWAEVDRLVSELAPAVPWVWENYPLIQSTDVAGVVNLNNASHDLSFISLK
jgi:peptide/nickel transport system substrate-binding protein